MKIRVCAAWLVGVCGALAQGPVVAQPEASEKTATNAASSSAPGRVAVIAYVEDYRRARLALAEASRLMGRETFERVEGAGRRALNDVYAMRFQQSLTDVIAAEPLAAVDVLIGISPYLTMDYPFGLALPPSNRTVHFLLKSPAMPWIEQNWHQPRPAGTTEPLRFDDLIDFAQPADERLAEFRAISREEIYRRVIARLPEVGHEKMFGVLVAMFQFDPWLAAITIDELAETGELPVKRPEGAKPTRAEAVKRFSASSQVELRKADLRSELPGPYVMLPTALELSEDRWWIRAALASELQLNKAVQIFGNVSAFVAPRSSPVAAAVDALLVDPHPVVRYVMFDQLSRNFYEESLARYRSNEESKDRPSSRDLREQKAEERRRERRALESRLGKPITEIPEPPKE